MAPTQSVAAKAGRTGAAIGVSAASAAPLDAALVEELWRASGAASWGLEREACGRILLEAGTAANFGLAEGEAATRHQQAAFFRGLCLADLVLARACAAGDERAWQQFVTEYRHRLEHAAAAITGNETVGRDLADQLYAELYGLNERGGERRCPLASYRGRGSLMGWLRTTLAQRHVDHHRRTRREEPLEELDAQAADPEEQTPAGELSQLKHAIEEALRACDAEERYLLAAYYLDGRTLLQIARVLGVHEATVSRKLHRAAEHTRRQVLKNLRREGMSQRAAEETLGADPRDVAIDLKKLLQHSQQQTFQGQATQ